MHKLALAALAAALIVGPSQAQNYTVSYGGAPAKGTCEQVARKAVEAMAKLRFLYAAVTEDGNVLGWTEHTTALVMVVPQSDQVIAVCIAVGRNNDEAGRLRLAIAAHIHSAPDHPAAPEVFCSKGGQETRAPYVNWAVDKRPAVSTGKYFGPVASLMLEKRGFNVFSEAGKSVVVGCSPDRAAASFAAPSASAISLYHSTVAFAETDEASAALLRELHSSVHKMLFE